MGKPADALWDRILENPDDADAYTVYADAVGGPIGERIVLMQQGTGAAVDAFLTKHRSKLYTPVLAKHRGIAWDWSNGFLRSVRYMPDISDDRLAIAKAILALPIAKVLRELVVFEERAARALSSLGKVTIAKKFTDTKDCREAKGMWLALSLDGKLPKQVFELAHLEYLELGGVLDAIGPDLAKLAKLRRLDIDWMPSLRTLDIALFGIESLGYISMYDCDGLGDRYHMGRVNSLLGGFVRAKTPSARRILETRLFLGEKPRASVADLVLALDSNMEVVRENALAQLGTVVKTPELDDAVFAVLGDFKQPKTKLLAQLAKLGTVAKKLDDTVTHVLLGVAPGRAIGDRVIVLEQHLGKPTGAFDPSRVLEQVIVQQDVKLDKKARDAAKKLLELHAPNIAAAVKTELKSSLLLESMGESKRMGRIAAFAKAAKVDGLELAQMLVARQRVGLMYVFANGTPADIDRALAAMVKDGVLDLNTAELATLPAQIAKVKIGELNLSSNHFATFPTSILAMSTLRKLDLSGNALSKVPPELGDMKLTHLDLGYCRFRKFPEAVLKIASLEELDVSNSENYVDDEIRITGMPAEIGRLKKLTKLRYCYQLLGGGFPDELFGLKHLTTLDLFQAELPDDIPSALAKLPLKQLDVRYTNWWDRRSELKKLLPGIDLYEKMDA